MDMGNGNGEKWDARFLLQSQPNQKGRLMANLFAVKADSARLRLIALRLA